MTTSELFAEVERGIAREFAGVYPTMSESQLALAALKSIEEQSKRLLDLLSPTPGCHCDTCHMIRRERAWLVTQGLARRPARDGARAGSHTKRLK